MDSKKYARFQIEKIQKKTEILKEGNVVGKKVFEINHEDVRELIEGDYRIIYEPEQQILLISVITIRSRGDVYRR